MRLNLIGAKPPLHDDSILGTMLSLVRNPIIRSPVTKNIVLVGASAALLFASKPSFAQTPQTAPPPKPAGITVPVTAPVPLAQATAQNNGQRFGLVPPPAPEVRALQTPETGQWRTRENLRKIGDEYDALPRIEMLDVENILFHTEKSKSIWYVQAPPSDSKFIYGERLIIGLTTKSFFRVTPVFCKVLNCIADQKPSNTNPQGLNASAGLIIDDVIIDKGVEKVVKTRFYSLDLLGEYFYYSDPNKEMHTVKLAVKEIGGYSTYDLENFVDGRMASAGLLQSLTLIVVPLNVANHPRPAYLNKPIALIPLANDSLIGHASLGGPLNFNNYR